jgi:cyclopropane fatty-acyl-phospholipid synthase-like methyltransferase
MSWYETWFDSSYYHTLYSHRNDEEAAAFVDLLLQKVDIPEGEKVLDLCCGRGRHAVQIYKKGYDVTGVDLSANNIELASRHACSRLRFIEHDMRQPLEGKYRLILNLFTSFGYFDTEAEHLHTLQSVRDALETDGIFVQDFLNVKKAKMGLIPEEAFEKEGIRFSLFRKIQNGSIVKKISLVDNGCKHSFEERVKAFELADFQQMYDKVGLQITDVFGDYQLGDFHALRSDRLILLSRPK